MRRYGQNGMTLIEVLIVIVVLGVLALSFYQMRGVNSRIQKNHFYRQKAVWVLENQAQWVRAQTFTGLKVASDVPFADGGEFMGLRGALGQMDISRAGDNLKRIDLKFDWMDAFNRKQTLTLTLYRHSS